MPESIKNKNWFLVTKEKPLYLSVNKLKVVIKKNVVAVRMPNPKSGWIFLRPYLANTDVSPAKTIDKSA